MTDGTQKKIKKIPGVHMSPRSSFTRLYCVFTLVYSGITPALLGRPKNRSHGTQTDHAVAFQNFTRDPPTCEGIWFVKKRKSMAPGEIP